MPKWLHKKLVRGAKRKGISGEEFERYVYGGMENWRKKQDEKYLKRKKEVARP